MQLQGNIMLWYSACISYLWKVHLDNFPNSRKLTLPSLRFHSDFAACIMYILNTDLMWNNFCPIIYLKVQRWPESTNSPLHVFVCCSCGYYICRYRKGKIMISAASLVLLNPTDKCTVNQRGQVNSTVHYLIFW